MMMMTKTAIEIDLLISFATCERDSHVVGRHGSVPGGQVPLDVGDGPRILAMA